MSRVADAFTASSGKGFIKSSAWARSQDIMIPPGLNVLMRAYHRGAKPFTTPDEQWSDAIYQRQSWHYFGIANGVPFDFTFVAEQGLLSSPIGIPLYEVSSSGTYPVSNARMQGAGILSSTETERTVSISLVGAVGSGTLVITLDQPLDLDYIEETDAALRAAYTTSLFKTAAESFYIPSFVLLRDNTYRSLANATYGILNDPLRERLASWLASETFGVPISTEGIGSQYPTFVYPGTSIPVRFGAIDYFPYDMVRILILTWLTIEREDAWSEMEFAGFATGNFIEELTCVSHLGGVERVDVPPLFEKEMLSRHESPPADLEFPSEGRSRIIYPVVHLLLMPSPIPPATCFP